MTDVLRGDVWCSKDAERSSKVRIVTCRAGRRIRLRRLTGRAAGKEILVTEDQLRAAFQYEGVACGRLVVDPVGEEWACELARGHEPPCLSMAGEVRREAAR
jgi:hypothetical protein